MDIGTEISDLLTIITNDQVNVHVMAENNDNDNLKPRGL